MIASPHVLALYILKSAAVAGHAASREQAQTMQGAQEAHWALERLGHHVSATG